LVRQLEVVRSGLGSELAAAAVQEGGPAGAVEPVGRREREIDAQAVRVRAVAEVVRDLLAVTVPEVERFVRAAEAEVEVALRQRPRGEEDRRVDAAARD